MAYPLEALLRPAYELRAAAVSCLGAAAVLTSPSTFLLPPAFAWGIAGIFVCHAGWRGYAGLRIVRYRANLRRQRRYVVTSEDIPWSAERLFLGRGFHWDQRHTQRLHEARLPEKRDMLQPGLIGRIADFLRPPSPEQSAVGGDPAIHGVEPAESDIWMDIRDRVGHTLVLGTNGHRVLLCSILQSRLNPLKGAFCHFDRPDRRGPGNRAIPGRLGDSIGGL